VPLPLPVVPANKVCNAWILFGDDLGIKSVVEAPLCCGGGVCTAVFSHSQRFVKLDALIIIGDSQIVSVSSGCNNVHIIITRISICSIHAS